MLFDFIASACPDKSYTSRSGGPFVEFSEYQFELKTNVYQGGLREREIPNSEDQVIRHVKTGRSIIFLLTYFLPFGV